MEFGLFGANEERGENAVFCEMIKDISLLVFEQVRGVTWQTTRQRRLCS